MHVTYDHSLSVKGSLSFLSLLNFHDSVCPYKYYPMSQRFCLGNKENSSYIRVINVSD